VHCDFETTTTQQKAEFIKLDHASLARKILAENEILNDKITACLECDPELVPTALAEVIRFLSLISISDDILTPSQRVDLAWHEFILCTRVYARFCDRQIGRFIHHSPGGSDDMNRHRFAKTLRLYQRYFGQPDTYFWGNTWRGPADPDCGACEAV